MAKVKESKKLDDGIYLINQAEPPKLPNVKKIVFTILGNQQTLEQGYPVLSGKDAENMETACAKREIINKKETFFIKIDDEGMLFNPINPGPTMRDHKYKMLKGQDKSWQYIQVNQDCFTQYLEFLRTKNVLHLKYSERNR